MKLALPYKRKNIARTLTGKEISLYCHGSGRLKALLLGGVHGDEPESFHLAERFSAELQRGALALDERLGLYICERINPDGCEKLRRTNHRNVDLNRNLPSQDWQSEFEHVRYYPGPKAKSEIESIITVKLIRKIKPDLIISLHSYEKAMVNYNGPSQGLAQAMSIQNGLAAKADIGYPTPGSLGSYAGWERKIPTITLEILRGQKEKEVWVQHSQALCTALEHYLGHAKEAKGSTS